MAKNEPVRHHFIPQFILRNFTDKNGYLNYFDKKTNKQNYLLPEDVFVCDNLYRDDKNSPDLPVEIEKDLSILEGKVAPIISKMLGGDEVILSKQEEQLLQVFVNVMSFRSKRTKDAFTKKLKSSSKEFYARYQKDGDMESWWKRNLGQLVKCKTMNEVMNNPKIDDITKLFFWQDAIGFEGSYFMIYRIKGKDKLVISDTYPLVDSYENGFNLKFDNFYLPIAPDRILILMKIFPGPIPASSLLPSEKFIRKPKVVGDSIIYQVGKVFKNYVDAFNKIAIDTAEIGYIFYE